MKQKLRQLKQFRAGNKNLDREQIHKISEILALIMLKKDYDNKWTAEDDSQKKRTFYGEIGEFIGFRGWQSSEKLCNNNSKNLLEVDIWVASAAEYEPLCSLYTTSYYKMSKLERKLTNSFLTLMTPEYKKKSVGAKSNFRDANHMLTVLHDVDENANDLIDDMYDLVKQGRESTKLEQILHKNNNLQNNEREM